MIFSGRFSNTLLAISASPLLFIGATNAAEPDESDEPRAAQSTQKPLDLRAPDITELYSQDEIKRYMEIGRASCRERV